MRAAIETARLRKQRTSELAAEARYARERYDLYKARTYGPTMTSPAKLRALKRPCERSAARLRSAWTAPDPSDHEPV
jgi:hypothetical protein